MLVLRAEIDIVEIIFIDFGKFTKKNDLHYDSDELNVNLVDVEDG